MPAENEFTRRHLVSHHGSAFDDDLLALVIVLLLVDIPIPLGIHVIINDQKLLGHIVRQRILNVVHQQIVFTELIQNLAFPVCNAADLMSFHLPLFEFIVLLAAVESDHLSIAQLLESLLPDVGVVHEECGGIHQHDLLIDYPSQRHVFIKLRQAPHAVPFDDDSSRLEFIAHGGQIEDRQIRRLLDPLDDDFFVVLFIETIRFVFDFAFFAEQEQCPLSFIEISGLQSVLYKCSLARIKKSGEHVYRQFHWCVHWHILKISLGLLASCSVLGSCSLRVRTALR